LEPSVSGSAGQTVTLRRDAQTGLLDAESFAESASSRVREAKKKVEELSFTVLRIGDLAELRSQLGRDDQESLLTTVGAALKAGSAGGGRAGRAAGFKY